VRGELRPQQKNAGVKGEEEGLEHGPPGGERAGGG
jgi:hypothetical protein